MIFYRIVRSKYATDLSGRGGLLSAARWHDHMPVIYASVHSSTAILEKRVHLDVSEMHHDLTFATLRIPDDASALTLNISDLPENWKRYPAPPILQKIGNAWLISGKSLLLYVPSSIDPYAQNVLVNPLHPDAKSVEVDEIIPFMLDDRLL